jgi:hypothetical protein
MVLHDVAINIYMSKYGKVRENGGNLVPREGYRTISVTNEVYQYVKRRAEETNRTIPEYIKHLIEKEKGAKEAC